MESDITSSQPGSRSLREASEPAAGAAAVRLPDAASFAEALSDEVPGEGPRFASRSGGAWHQLPAPCETRREHRGNDSDPAIAAPEKPS
ncbi:hypothetical protein GCM10009573_04370 [Agromyces bracchium]